MPVGSNQIMGNDSNQIMGNDSNPFKRARMFDQFAILTGAKDITDKWT